MEFTPVLLCGGGVVIGDAIEEAKVDSWRRMR
jgi:hypothetical protein